MAIILRLQGLDVKAGTEDIRAFFKCLHIPVGGVYIVGGCLREAFIAFTAERDAQLAMRYTGSFLKGSKVTLHMSSMKELEHKLELLLKRKKSFPMQVTAKRPQPSPDANQQPLNAWCHAPDTTHLPVTSAGVLDPRIASHPQTPNTLNLETSNALDANTAFLLGVCTVLRSLQSSNQTEKSEAMQSDFPRTPNTFEPNEVKTPEPGYVRLFGLPASATKEVICSFFKGLTVQEAIVNAKLGIGHGCLVKFASQQEASDALLFNQQLLGSICVEVRGATEKMWNSVLQECDFGEGVKPKQSPLRETANHRQKWTSTLQIKRGAANHLPSKSAKKPRHCCDSTTALSTTMEYTVMVSNLPNTMTKTEIKELFGCPNIAHQNVLHLLDKEGNRTDTAFLIFNCTEDYEYALNLTGCHVGSAAIEVSTITKKMMRDMMCEAHPKTLEPSAKKKCKFKKNKFHLVETAGEAQSMNEDSAALTYMLVRNMPADVKKSQIKRFFCNYRLKQDNIFLLDDIDGNSIGEAVVQFKSQKLAALAQRLHGQDFLGANVLLTRITAKQMQDILAKDV